MINVKFPNISKICVTYYLKNRKTVEKKLRASAKLFLDARTPKLSSKVLRLI